MSFQQGDQAIGIDGHMYPIRLSIGALAEIGQRLSLSGPRALAQRLRSLRSDDGRVLLACVMRPCLPSGDAPMPAAHFSDDQIATILPVICTLFENSFGGSP